MRQEQLRAVLGYLHQVAGPDGGGLGDNQLLDRWRNQRDPLAFEVVVWRHGEMVWNVCRRLLAREPDVEDAFQATFLTFLRKADTIGKGQFLGSWLYKVAYRTALAARASSAKRHVHEQIDSDFPEKATEADGWAELGPVLDEEVNRLPEKYRRPFVLCYLEGKTTDEAAQDLGCPRGTVGTRLAWARERLRARLTKRGVALSAVALTTLLSEKAGAESVPAALVANTVQASTFSAAGKAVAAGVISSSAATLSQAVLQTTLMTKLKTIAVALCAVGILGSGAGMLTQETVAGPVAKTQIADVKQLEVPSRTDWQSVSLEDIADRIDEENSLAANEDKTTVPKRKDGIYPQLLSGTVVQIDQDGKGFGLRIPSKVNGEAFRKQVKLTDRTQLAFSKVGPNEARLAEGYSAEVWLEKDSTDVAARVQLSGFRNGKNAPHRTGQVVNVTDGGKGITLDHRSKGEPAETTAIRFTNETRVLFSNVGRESAHITAGQEAQVWLDDDSRDTAKSVIFFGITEPMPPKSKEQKADRTGTIVSVSSDGKVLIVETPAAKGEEPARTEIKLTDATRESYHGVAADGAKPTEGYGVQVWLAEGSQETAARVRFVRNDPRKSLDARILAVSADGGRLSLEIQPRVKGGESTRREIEVTAQTKLVFANVGLGGAKLTEGYHVRGRLMEGSDDIADELMLSPSGTTDGKKGVPK